MNPDIARLISAKEERRRQLAKLSFPEKVKAVVRLQEMAAPILRRRGRDVRVWPGLPTNGPESPQFGTEISRV